MMFWALCQGVSLGALVAFMARDGTKRIRPAVVLGTISGLGWIVAVSWWSLVIADFQ